MQLLGCAVADAHGARPTISLQVGELALLQLPASIERIDRLQLSRVLRLGAPRVHPAHESLGLFGETESQQRVDGERGIPHPDVAIVPVAVPAYAGGKPERRRRQDTSGATRLQQLEHERGAIDLLLPSPVVVRPADPRAPEVHRPLELPRHVRAIQDERRDAIGKLLEDDGDALTSGESEFRDDVVAVFPQRNLRDDAQPQRVVFGRKHRLVTAHLRRVWQHTIAESRRAAKSHLERPTHGFDSANDPARRGAAGNGHEVRDLTHSVVREHARQENVRVG